jgi:hypothetical protein
MAIVLADKGADEILITYFNGIRAGNNLTLRLYTNDYTPLQTSSNASYTDAAGGDYGPKTLALNNWTVNAANDPSDAVYAEQTFTFTGNLTGNAAVFGYFVTDANNTAVWGERFANNFTPTNNGDNIKVTPKFQLSSGTPS